MGVSATYEAGLCQGEIDPYPMGGNGVRAIGGYHLAVFAGFIVREDPIKARVHAGPWTCAGLQSQVGQVVLKLIYAERQSAPITRVARADVIVSARPAARRPRHSRPGV